MANRTANYTAFYVKEPFDESNLGANATPDFLYYNQLKAWKAADSSFPFIDAHAKTYNVRDDSEWETLKKRLHERLDVSKNIILFLSDNTKNSQALREEIDYGINTKGLPVIVIYPDFTVLNVKQRKIFYWEHRGMMDDREYSIPAVWRVKEYEKNGIFLGGSLIITEETLRQPLGTDEIKNVIHHYLLS